MVSIECPIHGLCHDIVTLVYFFIKKIIDIIGELVRFV